MPGERRGGGGGVLPTDIQDALDFRRLIVDALPDLFEDSRAAPQRVAVLDVDAAGDKEEVARRKRQAVEVRVCRAEVQTALQVSLSLSVTRTGAHARTIRSLPRDASQSA